ncbi:MAG: hypothetical protein GY789_26485 [Hyphomicrobiales bacterium]|nr:hypothetical protein [Hyphomicrobiales bacterium]MCP5000473.1 hypothetical protein [Hyphomicrobiales bacterium]
MESGLRHGEGTYTYADGTSISGSWRYGLKHGTIDLSGFGDMPQAVVYHGGLPEFSKTSALVQSGSVERNKSETTSAGDAESNPSTDLLPREKAELTETSADGKDTAVPGNVVWSVKRRNSDDKKSTGPSVVAQVSIPSKGLLVTVEMDRNTVDGLPSSHLAKIEFSLQDGFADAPVAYFSGIRLKHDKDDYGEGLNGYPTMLDQGRFLFGFKGFHGANSKNLSLLRGLDWIDIPFSYQNGTRAVLTLHKGVAGNAAFRETMQLWVEGDDQQSFQTEADGSPEPSGNAWSVQLASRNFRAEAQASINSLKQRHAALFEERDLYVKRKTISNRGTYFRVYLSADTRKDARNILQAA